MGNERDSIETKLRVSTEEIQSLKYELMASDNEKNRMGDKINSMDRENIQHCQVTFLHYLLFVKKLLQYI